MRVLLIDPNLASASDFIRAQRLISQFMEEFPERMGRHHHVLYGRDDTVAVWKTATQVTVRFFGSDQPKES